MGLRQWLANRAVRATRVLVVAAPKGFAVRVAVERAARLRGWSTAESPASADALVVAGDPGEELGRVVEGVWEAMPGPRAKAVVRVVEDVGAVLDDVARAFLDGAAQAEDAAGRAAPDLSADEGHEGTDHGDMEHGDMDHGDPDMAPDGIPLAQGSDEDRDGLEMDALQVRMGPVLRHWPPGLVLDVTLHGDLVVGANARLLDENVAPPSREDSPATRGRPPMRRGGGGPCPGGRGRG